MAESPHLTTSEQGLLESEACSNQAAFRLWAEALGAANPPCGPGESDSRALSLIRAFSDRSDIEAGLLAGLLLSADLRPDDRLWVDGAAPVWLTAALSFTAGRAAAPEQASVWIGVALPDALPAGIRRVILTGEAPAEGQAPPGVTVSRAADWVVGQLPQPPGSAQ